MKNIVCLISGRGSNLAALLAAAQAQDWAGALAARFACVISNRADAAGLDLAKQAGVATQVLEHRAFESREAFDAALAKVIDGYEPALIVLAGFMRVLGRPFVQRYAGRLINIHPSLLPAFPGLATHRQALDAGVRVHGATVHYVSAQVDGGAIIGQALVRVHDGETEADLAARVLAQEHILLPRCVRFILEDRVRWHPVGQADVSAAGACVGKVWCAAEVADQLLVMP
ncbi:MAG TPA: phosphoribosylglycinamide formyltransferase [Burkholderiaceae bacterium]|nr:phosphoribosylglycinamide formyltransferase [Burkholderiaceae bacterium]